MFRLNPFRPSPQKLVDEIFKGFSEEELLILRNTGSKCIPDLYSFLLGVCKNSRTRYSLRKSLRIAQSIIDLHKKDLGDKEVQSRMIEMFLKKLFV